MVQIIHVYAKYGMRDHFQKVYLTLSWLNFSRFICIIPKTFGGLPVLDHRKSTIFFTEIIHFCEIHSVISILESYCIYWCQICE